MHQFCVSLCALVSVGIIFCLQSSFTSLKQQFSEEMLIWQWHIVPADFYNISVSTIRPGVISPFSQSVFEQSPASCNLHRLLSCQRSLGVWLYVHFSHHRCTRLLLRIHLLSRTSDTGQPPLTPLICESFPGPLLTGVSHSVNNSHHWLHCAKISGGCHFLEQHVWHRQPHYI